MATIVRGTTPTITVEVSGIDLTGYTCHLGFGRLRRGSVFAAPWCVADNDQMTLTVGTETVDGESVTVSTLAYVLTQDQTLAMEPGQGYAQLRYIDGTDASASLAAPYEVADCIEDGVITDA